MAQTKCLPDKTSKAVLTKRLPDKTSILTKRLLTYLFMILLLFKPFCLNKCSPNIFRILSLLPNYTFGSGQSANLPCKWLFNLQLSGVGKKQRKKTSLCLLAENQQE